MNMNEQKEKVKNGCPTQSNIYNINSHPTKNIVSDYLNILHLKSSVFKEIE